MRTGPDFSGKKQKSAYQDSLNMSRDMFPGGYRAAGWNIGIKDDTPDFAVIFSEVPAAAAAVFTRNNFPGFPVIVGRENVANGKLQAIVVNSKNANVATGDGGLRVARETCSWVAQSLGIAPDLILPSSTGVIGRPMPEEKIRAACAGIPDHLSSADFEQFARAIMTTDLYPKMKSDVLTSGIKLVTVAKGAGMIEPNMATMLAYTLTDAEILSEDLNRMIRCVVNRTFNRLSVDSDTSTSDTFVILANGHSGKKVSFSPEAAAAYDQLSDPFVPGALDAISSLTETDREFVAQFALQARDLTRMIARDGEGATKLIELVVNEASNKSRALKIARSVINSPLVKTAMYGGDPNWGRFVMAIGKVFDEPVSLERLQIDVGGVSLKGAPPENLLKCSQYLKNEEIRIVISLGEGEAQETVWGCDLNEEYIKINAHYTT